MTSPVEHLSVYSKQTIMAELEENFVLECSDSSFEGECERPSSAGILPYRFEPYADEDRHSDVDEGAIGGDTNPAQDPVYGADEIGRLQNKEW